MPSSLVRHTYIRPDHVSGKGHITRYATLIRNNVPFRHPPSQLFTPRRRTKHEVTKPRSGRALSTRRAKSRINWLICPVSLDLPATIRVFAALREIYPLQFFASLPFIAASREIIRVVKAAT